MSIVFGDFLIHSSQVFYQGKYTFGMVNLRPIVPLHLLLCPFRTITEISHLMSKELEELFYLTQRVSRSVNQGNSMICVQNGVLAGQTVPHLHVHVMPRHVIRLHPDSGQKARTLEEMSREATKIRELLIH